LMKSVRIGGTSFTSCATTLPSINAFVDSPRQPGGANGGANKPLTRQVAVTPMPGPGLEPGRGCPQEILRGLGRWDLGGLQREKITGRPGRTRRNVGPWVQWWVQSRVRRERCAVTPAPASDPPASGAALIDVQPRTKRHWFLPNRRRPPDSGRTRER
jgi:hypothetical protein